MVGGLSEVLIYFSFLKAVSTSIKSPNRWFQKSVISNDDNTTIASF